MRPSPLFSKIETGTQTYDNVNRATYLGIGVKTIILLLITIASAIITAIYINYLALNIETLTDTQVVGLVAAVIVASLLSLICGIVGRFSDRLAIGCSIIYSVSEGLLLGLLTGILEMIVPHIGVLSVFGTLIIFAIMLFLFLTGVVKAGNTLKAILLGSILGAFSLSLFSIIYLFASGLMGTFNDSTYILLIIGVEFLLLIFGVVSLTFNFIEASCCVSNGASKSAEWRVALGLEVSLIYIYIRLLRIILYISQFVRRN